MLTACAGSQPPLSRPAPAPDPVVTTKVQTRLVCPAELNETPPAAPAPGSDAKVATNPAGSAYLAALVSWGNDLLRRLNDAGAACKAEQADAGGYQ